MRFLTYRFPTVEGDRLHCLNMQINIFCSVNIYICRGDVLRWADPPLVGSSHAELNITLKFFVGLKCVQIILAMSS